MEGSLLWASTSVRLPVTAKTKANVAQIQKGPYRSGRFRRWCRTKLWPGRGSSEPLIRFRTCEVSTSKKL